MKLIVRGLIAGVVATLPMTGVMLAVHRRLPVHERYPIPPKLITLRVLHRSGMLTKLSRRQRDALTATSHLGYGGAAGAAYAASVARLPGPPIVKGVGFGLAVWAGSYLGWLPAARILPPATAAPARRNAMMIASHIVWGAAVGLTTGRVASEQRRGSGDGRAPLRSGRSRTEPNGAHEENREEGKPAVVASTVTRTPAGPRSPSPGAPR